MTDDDCICDSLVDDADPNCPVHAPKTLAEHFAADIDTGEPDPIAEPGETPPARTCGQHQLVLAGEITTFWCSRQEGHDGPCDTRKVATESLVPKPDPAPEWQSWPMITAGDGRNFERNDFRGLPRWRQIGHPLNILTDDQIAALGTVRRCVLVTLADDDPEYVELDDFNWLIVEGTHHYQPGDAQRLAAELIAAALHAEAGDRP